MLHSNATLGKTRCKETRYARARDSTHGRVIECTNHARARDSNHGRAIQCTNHARARGNTQGRAIQCTSHARARGNTHGRAIQWTDHAAYLSCSPNSGRGITSMHPNLTKIIYFCYIKYRAHPSSNYG